MSSLTLRVLSPEKVVFEAPIASINLESDGEGYLGILPGHQPLVTPLAVHILEFVDSANQRHSMALLGGLLSTDGQVVTVLCEAAELSSDIDTARAEQAKKRAEARLHSKESGLDQDRAELALKRAIIRLQAAH